MIEWLMQRGFGGCEGTRLHLGERLTLCTGESETGKSRLLDCLWHAAAGTWPGEVNEQISGSTGSGLGAPNAVIATVLSGCNGAERRPVQTDGRQRTANDTTETDRPDTVYAHANGAMSIVGPDGALSLSPRQVWTGNSEPFETWPFGTRVQGNLQWEGATSRLRSAFGRGTKATEILAEILDELLGRGTRKDSAGSDAVSRVLNEPATVQARGGAAGRWIALGVVLDWLREARSKAGHRRDLLVLVDDIERGLHPRRQRRVLNALTRAVGRDPYQRSGTDDMHNDVASRARFGNHLVRARNGPADPATAGGRSQSTYSRRARLLQREDLRGVAHQQGNRARISTHGPDGGRRDRTRDARADATGANEQRNAGRAGSAGRSVTPRRRVHRRMGCRGRER